MSDYFPSEVIVEILQRLPLKSIVRCMCVCKAWKSIITTDSFITSHRSLQTNNSSLFFHLSFRTRVKADGTRELTYAGSKNGYFEGFYSEAGVNLFWEFHPARIVGSCNGVVCFSEDPKSVFTQYVIWNPSIHKYVKLPKPSFPNDPKPVFNQFREPVLHSIFSGFGFDSRSHDFKLVRFISPPRAEIYTHASRSWRTINAAASPFASPFYIIDCSGHKFVNGVLHWMAFRKINGMKYNFILTFDLAEEKFGEFMLPPGLEGESFISNVCILTGGNSLAVIHKKEYSCHEKCCEIWIMKEYGVVESWNQLYHFPTIHEIFEALMNCEELVLITDEGIIIQHPINGVEKKLGHEFGLWFVDYYVESLFLINEKNAGIHLSL